jgi:hypothetical protein
VAQFCAHCGIPLYDEGAFCHGCGKPKVEAATIRESAAASPSEPQDKGGAPVSQMQQTVPQPTPVSVSLETPFSQVFSVTGKVILALFVIGLGIGLLYLIIGALGNTGYSGSSSGSATDYSRTYLESRAYYDKDADEAPTKVPLSQWKTMIAADIAGHCVRPGMTSDEVRRAVGEPTSKEVVPPPNGDASSNGGEAWQYVKREQVSKPCSKYEGDKCADPVEYKTEKATLYFSPNGHLTYPYLSEGLKTDSGEYATCR